MNCIACGERPVREPLADERGEQITVGLLTCQQCCGQEHAWGCNDPAPHDAPDGCTRKSWRPAPMNAGQP